MLKTDPATWTDPRHVAGVAAEQRAMELLRAEGYQVLEHRYRYRRHDIDVVARLGSTVVFVEVKTRKGSRFGTGAEAVHGRKQRDLVKAAASWIQRHGQPMDVARFDLITVDDGRITWIQGAFRPGWR